MIDENEAIQRMIIDEGLRLQPYKCSAGKLTIGIGRNLESNPLTAEEIKFLGRRDLSAGITRHEAYYLLRNDLKRTEADCRRRIGFFYRLDDKRQFALVNMAFNMGIDGLCGFKKMLGYMGTGNYREAAAECLNSKYAKEVGDRAKRIAKIIETGNFIYEKN